MHSRSNANRYALSYSQIERPHNKSRRKRDSFSFVALTMIGSKSRYTCITEKIKGRKRGARHNFSIECRAFLSAFSRCAQHRAARLGEVSLTLHSVDVACSQHPLFVCIEHAITDFIHERYLYVVKQHTQASAQAPFCQHPLSR